MKIDVVSATSQGAPNRGALGFFLIISALLLPSGSVDASNDAEISPGSFVYQVAGENGGSEVSVSLPLETDVQMAVSGWVNRVKVKQTFKNISGEWLNGSYLFPLPNEAAVDGMKLLIGSRVVEGRIKERLEAKKVFEQAKSEGKRASLVESNRPNIFKTSVANLGPGELLVVEISYQELVDYNDGEFSLRFPMVVNPRYYPESGSEQTEDFQYQTLAGYGNWPKEFSAMGSSIGEEAGRDHNAPTVNIRVDLDAGVALSEITSPYHTIDKSPLDNTRYQINLTNQVAADRDFVLHWKPVAGSEPRAGVFVQKGLTYASSPSQKYTSKQTVKTGPERNVISDSDYALVMLLPPSLKKSRNRVSRELILVIDTSGSMSGSAIEQAKKSMKFALAGLGTDDTFNVIEFNSRVSSLSEGPIQANAKNIAMANRFVQSLTADGGTEMALALDYALGQKTSTSSMDTTSMPGSVEESVGRLRQVLFMTDGAVGNEAELFNLIKYQIGKSRLFTLGIGSAPNSHFMQRAAEFGRGTFTYIGDLDEVQEKIQSLLYKIERPQVTDIELHYPDGTIPDFWPATIPDLYAEEPLLVAIKMPSDKYANSPDKLVISGAIAGRYWQDTVSLNNKKLAAGLDLIWANKQIAALELSKDGVNSSRVKQQITALALKYHLVSKHTSLVAVDITPVKHSSIISNNAAVLPLTPFGWKPPAGSLPQTGTDSRLLLATGLLLLCLLCLYIMSFRLKFRMEIVERLTAKEVGGRDAL
ncbi:marine proteobacterial sortase target protein [Shewanella atlantica]|uniref:Marine proteobacterial sortase target protein n=1 Tax=Shewanella atlantica TaxID=271099 RepID=A0A3S0KS94_9GAMM|nr:marine proteobacterial sortase target protein [Shewanella atlantica]RTR33252.1 marine proteobacterial sortase target protein [Shewanella atlantica]